MNPYNYDQFSTGNYDLDNSLGPMPGDKAPDFTLTRADGSSQNLLTFDGAFLVLETGSITCPLFQSRRAPMQRFCDTFPNVAFRVLYVREAHPGSAIGQHQTQADKNACAAELKSRDHEGRTILVDTLDGDAHRAYGSYPNAVFIINKRGCVVFQADWNNPAATGRALKSLLAGRAANNPSYFLPAKPPVALRTLRRAGKGAAADFILHLPRLIWKNGIKRNLQVLLRRHKAVPPDANC